MREKLTAQQLANQLGVSTATVYNWKKKGAPHEVTRKGLREVSYYEVGVVLEWLEKGAK